MKEYKIYSVHPDSPLPISQEQCDRVSKGLKDKLSKYYSYVLPMTEMMSEAELYRLDYLNSALDLSQEYKGFDKHIAEYKNNFNSTFFVTVISDLLLSHGLIVELEPESEKHSKKADLLAYQKEDGLRIYFECKQANDDPKHLLKEQRLIFDGIKDVISNQYSLACFYKKELDHEQIFKFRELIIASITENSHIEENRVLVQDDELGLALVVSGVSDNLYKGSRIEMSGLLNFSEERKYSHANGFNHEGKSILFYKDGSKNTIDGLLKNSRKKVISGSAYVVCLDLSGPRFDWSVYEEHISRHFYRGDYKSISAVLFVEHGLTEDACYGITTGVVMNANADYRLDFLSGFFHSPIKMNIQARQSNKI